MQRLLAMTLGAGAGALACSEGVSAPWEVGAANRQKTVVNIQTSDFKGFLAIVLLLIHARRIEMKPWGLTVSASQLLATRIGNDSATAARRGSC